MQIWVALLRGINVGGKNKLPMKGLVAELEHIGLSDIMTYIQSGNAVFRGPETQPSALAAKIGAAINGSYGFRPHVLVMRKNQFQQAVAGNPFPEAEADGKALNVFFLSGLPKNIDPGGLDAVKLKSESWKIRRDVFYLYAPEGFHGSKIAANVEKLLGVQATARNWRSVLKVLELVNSLE